ncbi:MAG: tail fiber domain-containing protein [Lewinellaceae bacterium]|nr:tail fiber domain-containing protein [Lewinellaceae bacterium]
MKQFLSLLSMLLLCLISIELAAQNDLLIKASNGNVLLEVREEGVIVKKVTTAERTGFALAATDNGLLVYDTDLDAFFTWDGAQWVQIAGTNLSTLADADNDTKIQVEKNPDEDIIRFDVAGTEAAQISAVIQNGGTIETGTGVQGYGSTSPAWQSFTATADAQIQSIEIMYNINSGYPTKSFAIYEGEGTGGTLLASLGSYTLSQNGWNQITLPTPISMSSGAKYTLWFSNLYGVGFFGNSYEGGRSSYNINEDWSIRVNWGTYQGQLTTSSLIIDNAYALPTTDGANGQVLTTDGSGAASWSTPIGYQDLSLSGNTLSISNGNSVTLSGDNDNDPTNEIELPTGGTNGQVLTTDGSNGVSWADLPATSIFADADNDTKIQVEKNPDEDIIRFDVAGIEVAQISNEILNEGTIETGTSLEHYSSSSPGWQSFTATVDAHINSIEIRYNTSYGGPAKSFAIYEGEGTGGTLLASFDGPTLQYGWNQITLPTPVPINSGAKYTIWFSSFGGVGFNYNPYSGGRSNIGSSQDWSTRVNWVSYKGQLTTSSLIIENAYALPTTDGTNGQVLTTDGSGAVSWSSQDLSLSGNTLSLTNDGTPVDLSGFMDSPWDENGGNVYRINGNIGIGTTNPTKAKLEISGSVPFDPPGNIGYLNAAGQTGSYDPSFFPYSIYASNVISGQEFHAHSDARIKNILGVSDSRSDLNTLLQIEITDYRMRDTIAHSSRATKKVIAQQVEQVYPQAVTADLTEVVPDIYQRTTAEGNWVMLATDLKVGERVKLITETANSIYTVTAVEADRFQVELPSNGSLSSTVFVYGREVNDFHTVDYEAIAMLNVSATQEQQRLIEAQQKRIAELEAQVAELEALKSDIQTIKAALNLPNAEAGSTDLIQEGETKK